MKITQMLKLNPKRTGNEIDGAIGEALEYTRVENQPKVHVDLGDKRIPLSEADLSLDYSEITFLLDGSAFSRDYLAMFLADFIEAFLVFLPNETGA